MIKIHFFQSLKEAIQLLKVVLVEPRGKEGERRTRSALYVELSVIMILCLVLLLVFFTFYTRHLVKTNSDARLQFMSTHVNSLISNADYLMEITAGQSLEQVNNINSIMALSYTTDRYTISAPAVARAKSDLRTMVANSALIEDACLYVYASNVAITASESFGGPAYSNLIESYRAGQVDQYPIELRENTVCLFQYGGKYIFARDLYVFTDERLSTIFLVLNTEEFYNHFCESLQEKDVDMRVYIYDAMGLPILPDGAQYPDFLPDTAYLSDGGMTDPVHVGKSYVCGKRSPQSKWQFYLVIDDSLVRPYLPSILATILPFCLLMLGVALLMSLLAALFLYLPFHSIISQLSESNIAVPSDASIHNEFDYLRNVIATMLTHQRQMSDMLQNVSNDVTLRLFAGLISGDPISYDELEYTLKNLNSEFQMNALYSVAVLRASGEGPENTQEIEQTVKLIETAMADFNAAQHTVSQVVRTTPADIAVVIQFVNVDTTIPSGRAALKELSERLLNTLTRNQKAYRFESGHLYHSILDVNFSYNEAMKALDMSEPVTRKGGDNPEEPTFRSLLDRRAGQLLDAAVSGGREAALRLCDSIVSEMEDATSDLTQLSDIATELLNRCVDQIMAYDYIDPKALPDSYSAFTHTAAGCADSRELASALRIILKELISAFFSQIQRQQNVHVVASQRFIEKHFTNPELSMNDIAASVGISSNYLSKLYNDCLGVGLLDYLTQYRVKMSLDPLLRSRRTIIEISEICGFTSSRNYIRAFKKMYGITPGEYRRQNAAPGNG